jgi:mannose-1-phosphate guanylyltransferase
MDNFYALILAGGGGTRLWPLSRKDKPKQMLPLVNDHTMFQMTVNRLLPLFPPERILVVTGRSYISEMRADAPMIPQENFIGEPYGRDNGPAVALALQHLHHRNPDAIVAMVTADHYIRDEERFRGALMAAHQIASEGRIVTLGIQPTYAATGFGYIQRGTREGAYNGFDAFRALKFTEKPSLATAERFVASRQYSWNSGMFIWSVAQGLAEFARQQPAITRVLDQIRGSIGSAGYDAALDAAWGDMPKISIDYAIMEHAPNMTVIPVNIGWSDVGTWESVFDILEKDGLGNCIRGREGDKYISLSSHDNYIQSDRLVVAIGVEDLIVIETEDVLMICRRDRAQDVKEVVQYLTEQGNTDYL